MHARRIPVDENNPRHKCNLCDDIMDGYVYTFEAYHLNDVTEQAIDDMVSAEAVGDLSTCTMLQCRDGCTCHEEDGEIWQIDELWACGDCGAEYTEAEYAADCCR